MATSPSEAGKAPLHAKTPPSHLGHHLLQDTLLRRVRRDHRYLIGVRRHALVDQISQRKIFITFYFKTEQAVNFVPVPFLQVVSSLLVIAV